MQSDSVPRSSAGREVEARLIERSRALPASVKLRQLGELIEALERLALADILRTTPGLDARGALLALAERRYGRAWVKQRVGGPTGV